LKVLLNGEQLMDIRKLAESMEKIFRWFDLKDASL
jgi:hypothetical protein